jgi:4-amino-4-deoxy-L-arabinose transferase-like glycosyltransferase
VAIQRFYAGGAPLAASTTRTLFVLGMVAVVLGVALSLPFRDLWEPDEARLALVARSMVESGDWLVPRLLGEPYTQKPPLYIWSIALLRLAGLPWTYAAVLPSLLALLGLLFVVPRLARTLGLGADVGWLGAAMLAAMPLVTAMGLGARMDIPLALTFTGCLLPLARLLGFGEPARSGDHLLLWLLIGVGVLLKGPVAVAMPAAVTLAVWLTTRPRPRVRPVLVGWGPPLALALVLAWLLPATLSAGAGYLRELLLTQSAGRIVDSFAHRQAIYYHLVTFPATALPWSVVALIAVVRVLRRRATGGEAFLAAIVVGLLAQFSLYSGKLIIYLLPTFPAVALLAASVLQREPRPYRWGLALGGLGLALGGAIVLYRTLQGTWLLDRMLHTAAASAVLCLVALAATAVAARCPGPAGPAPLVLVGLFVAGAVLPAAAVALDAALSARSIAHALERLEPDATTFVAYGMKPYGASLLLERPMQDVHSHAELADALAAARCAVLSRRQWQLVAGRPDVERLTLAVETARLRHRQVIVACPALPAQR